MRKLALGVVAAATICTAVPAMAQVGFYAGPGGVGVQLGGPRHYAPYDRYYDYYGGPAPGPVVRFHDRGWHGHARYHEDHHRR